MQTMNGRFQVLHTSLLIVGMLLAATGLGLAAPKPAAVSAFNRYISEVEARLNKQHESQKEFLAPEDATRLSKGEQIIEQVTPSVGSDLPGAMLHHWRG